MAVTRTIPAGDIALVTTAAGKKSFQWLSGPAYIRQKLSSRFRFFRGEWFLNLLEGAPYYQAGLGDKHPNLDVLGSMFRRLILGCPGVLSLVRFSLKYDEAARQVSFEFQAKVEGGEVVVTAKDRDFQLDLPAAA